MLIIAGISGQSKLKCPSCLSRSTQLGQAHPSNFTSCPPNTTAAVLQPSDSHSSYKIPHSFPCSVFLHVHFPLPGINIYPFLCPNHSYVSLKNQLQGHLPNDTSPTDLSKFSTLCRIPPKKLHWNIQKPIKSSQMSSDSRLWVPVYSWEL